MQVDIEGIVNWTINAVQKFINENPTLKFYAFAFDCNAEYAEINLCFNTEEAFAERLTDYQSSDLSGNYKMKEKINELKYNTGDWKYQSFSTFYALEEDDLNVIFNDIYPNEVDDDYLVWQQFTTSLLESFTKSILMFSETSVFKKINKTKDFKFFCIDYDEELEVSMKRMTVIEEKLKKS